MAFLVHPGVLKVLMALQVCFFLAVGNGVAAHEAEIARLRAEVSFLVGLPPAELTMVSLHD